MPPAAATAGAQKKQSMQYGDSPHCVCVKSHPTGLDLSFRGSMDRIKKSDEMM